MQERSSTGLSPGNPLPGSEYASFGRLRTAGVPRKGSKSEQTGDPSVSPSPAHSQTELAQSAGSADNACAKGGESNGSLSSGFAEVQRGPAGRGAADRCSIIETPSSPRRGWAPRPREFLFVPSCVSCGQRELTCPAQRGICDQAGTAVTCSIGMNRYACRVI